jgi:hypothetical protein
MQGCCLPPGAQVEARRLSDGQLVCRDSLGGPVAGLLVGDYRGDGTQQLVALSTEGEVRGYVPQPPGAAGTAAVPEPDLEQLQAAITQLGHRKQVGRLPWPPAAAHDHRPACSQHLRTPADALPAPAHAHSRK